MAVYENPGDPNDHRWMLVTDGACMIRRRLFEPCRRREHACLQRLRRRAFTASGTTHGVRNYVSTLNPLLTTANYTVPGPQYLTSAGLPTKTVCYPQNHQSNVKLFDLKTNADGCSSPTAPA